MRREWWLDIVNLTKLRLFSKRPSRVEILVGRTFQTCGSGGETDETVEVEGVVRT